jgi:ATP phosphoribosyltransferase
LDHAGYPTAAFRGAASRTTVDDLEFIEMRPRDAGAWLAARRIQAAFVSTDIVLEEGLGHLPALGLGFGRSELVVASRDDDGRSGAVDLDGGVVATHLPNATAEWLGQHGLHVTVVAMGGSLEGVCAAGLADGIVDLRETGTSLAQNRLRVLARIAACEAAFVYEPSPSLDDLVLRLGAALGARDRLYVMLHLPPDQVPALAQVFSGLAAPTVLPLAGHDDLVAVHLVAAADALWTRLGELQRIGATGIVAVRPDALLH